MSTEPQRTCRNCGNEFSGTMEFCPVCMLRIALAGGESGESSASEDTGNPTPEQSVQRFEHYELVTGEDGKSVELGRGAMGVTYKAFDVDLHCPVTLKVISERYLGDESARLRFLREARAAASVRHLLKAIPTITRAIGARRRITREDLRKMPPPASCGGTRRPPARVAPKKISVARLPVTVSNVFGREEDITFLDDAWAKQDVNVVTIVAWAGVGKSTLVNDGLRRMAAQYPVEEVGASSVVCLCYEALTEWHFGEIVSCRAAITEAISLAKELNDMNALALALQFLAYIAYYSRDSSQAERVASDLIELSMRHNFSYWMAIGTIFRGWARRTSGDRVDGMTWLEDGISDYRSSGAVRCSGLWLHRLSGGRDRGAQQSQVSEFSKAFVKNA